MTTSKNKTVTKAKAKAKAKNPSDISVLPEPSTLPSYMNHGGIPRGHEEVGVEDLTIPRLDVIQDLSPHHKKNKPEYIGGAEVGMLFNTVTNKLYGYSVFFVPVYFRKEWVIWKDRTKGGGGGKGFNGAFVSEKEAKSAWEELDVPGDYDIVDTAQQFGVIINKDGTYEDIVISMSKSKMKASRQLNTLSKMAGGDRFSRVYRIQSTEEQNKNGDDYRSVSVSQLGFTPEDVYKHAEAMYYAISNGNRDINRDGIEES